MLMADLPDPGLARVAEETGGGYTEIRFGQDLGAAFAQVADELHSQYLLGLVPPKRDGKGHDIDVRVTRRGVSPRSATSRPRSDEATGAAKNTSTRLGRTWLMPRVPPLQPNGRWVTAAGTVRCMVARVGRPGDGTRGRSG
jgi:hypothetical protein